MEGRICLTIVTSLALGCSLAALQAESRLSPAGVLSALEKTSAGTWRPSHAAVRKQVLGEASDSRLVVAADLLGPVSREALQHRFQWTIAEETARTVSLHASPRDPVDRMFLGTVELTISRATGLGESLRFLDEAAIGTATRKSEEHPIRLVSDIRVNQVAAETEEGSQVSRILDVWEKSTAAIQNVKLTFERYRYDRAFNLETRAVGRFVYVAPASGMYRIQPAPIPVGTESRILGTDGQRFTLRTDSPQSLVWNGMTVTVADDLHRTLQNLDVPKQDASIQRVVGSWDNVWAQLTQPQVALPCVVDVNVKDLRERFRLNILRSDDEQIVLQCLPNDPSARRQLSEMMVIIDSQTHLTKATKFVGPSGDLEVVHVFLYEQINQPELKQAGWAPDLKEYKTMDMPPPAPPAEGDEE